MKSPFPRIGIVLVATALSGAGALLACSSSTTTVTHPSDAGQGGDSSTAADDGGGATTDGGATMGTGASCPVLPGTYDFTQTGMPAGNDVDAANPYQQSICHAMGMTGSQVVKDGGELAPGPQMSCTLSSSDDGCTVTRDCSATDSQGTNTINEVFVVNADKKGAVDTQTVKIVDSKGGVNADCTITTTFTKQ